MRSRLHFDGCMASERTRRGRSWPPALGLLLACSCGRADEAERQAAPPPVAVADRPAVPSCALMPPAEVAAALGVEKLEIPVADIRGTVTTCTYAGDGAAARVTLRFELGASAASLAAARSALEGAGQRLADVTGAGERAFAASAPDGRRTLTFLVGTVQAAIVSTDPLTRQKKLAARVIERLGR